MLGPAAHPAAAGTLAAFGASGMFAGLAGLILTVTLGRSSHALAGATLCLVFSCGVVSQVATIRMPASRVLGVGTMLMLAGLGLLVASVRVSTPNLALFLLVLVALGVTISGWALLRPRQPSKPLEAIEALEASRSQG